MYFHLQKWGQTASDSAAHVDSLTSEEYLQSKTLHDSIQAKSAGFNQDSPIIAKASKGIRPVPAAPMEKYILPKNLGGASVTPPLELPTSHVSTNQSTLECVLAPGRGISWQNVFPTRAGYLLLKGSQVPPPLREVGLHLVQNWPKVDPGGVYKQALASGRFFPVTGAKRQFFFGTQKLVKNAHF